MTSDKTATLRKIVNCPQCKKETLYAPENEWRPFCSERCYKIDLGAWASESYKIPIVEKDASSDNEA